MVTEEQSVERSQETKTNRILQPFHGCFTPGICFESGHCLWMFNWFSSPTEFDGYSDIWLITPDEKRILYADPPEAGQAVETWHEFDLTVGAAISWSQTGEDIVECHLEGEDGTTLDFRSELGSSTGTSLLNTMTSLTPQPILRTGFGETISNLSLAQLMDVNGLKVAGITDTEEPYRVESDRLRIVTSATAAINGEDLGEITPPNRPIEFGDAITPDEPFFAFGNLFLRPPPKA